MKDANEFEVKLVITDSMPERIFDKLSRTDSLAGYPLQSAQRIHLHDYYFDTPSRNLQKARLSLRVRFKNAEPLVTLKGKTTQTDWGGINRMEIELPWSENNFKKIVEKFPDELQTRELQNFNAGDPVQTLQEADFEIIQSRRNIRITREINQSGSTGAGIGELALDQVEYILSYQKLTHFEIEIEALNDAGIQATRDINTELKSDYKDAVFNWSLSKLALGIILEKMEQKNQLTGKISGEGQLTAGGYRWIKEYFADIRE